MLGQKIMAKYLKNSMIHQIIKELEKSKAHRYVKKKILMKLDVLFIKDYSIL